MAEKYIGRKNNLQQENSPKKNAKKDHNSSFSSDQKYVPRTNYDMEQKNNQLTSNKGVDEGLKKAIAMPGIVGAAGKVANSKLGRKVINKGAELLQKNEKIKNATKRVNDIKDKMNGLKKRDNNPNKEEKEKEKKQLSKEDKKEDKKEKKSFAERYEEEIKKIIKAKIIAVSLIVLPVIVAFVGLIIIIATLTDVNFYFHAIGAWLFGNNPSSVESLGMYNVKFPEETEKFFKTAKEVQEELIREDKNNPNALEYCSAFFTIVSGNQSIMKKGHQYKDYSKQTLKQIQEAGFKDKVFDEETWKENIKNLLLNDYMINHDEEIAEKLVKEMIHYIKETRKLLNKNNICINGGSCNYEIKGISNGTSSGITFNEPINNIKIRLMQCGSAGGTAYGQGDWDTPAEDELVPFEKYVLGVAYGEIGESAPIEAAKAQIIAARSYTLARAKTMEGNLGKKIITENGSTIIQMANCVADQVYCDPDKGCVKKNDGEQGGQVRSGQDGGKIYKGPLAADSNLRKAASQVQGELLTDSNGFVVYTNYASVVQNEFSRKASEGFDYKQILLEQYESANKISKAICNNTGDTLCTTAGLQAVGEFTTWRQGDPVWASIPLGNSSYTIGSAGCTITSVSKLFARAISEGRATASQEFIRQMGTDQIRPDTVVRFLNQNGGFTGGGLLIWGATTQIISPTATYIGQTNTYGMSLEEFISGLTQKLNNKELMLFSTTPGGTGEHWLALDYIENGQVFVMDPGTGQVFDILTHPQYGLRNIDGYARYSI